MKVTPKRKNIDFEEPFSKSYKVIPESGIRLGITCPKDIHVNSLFSVYIKGLWHEVDAPTLFSNEQYVLLTVTSLARYIKKTTPNDQENLRAMQSLTKVLKAVRLLFPPERASDFMAIVTHAFLK